MQRPIVIKLSCGRSVGLSVCASVCPVHCGKTADRIGMPFGIIGLTGPGMRQVVGFGDRSMGRDTFGANLERAIVTDGDFTAYVCDTAATRPSSQITVCRLVVSRSHVPNIAVTFSCYLATLILRSCQYNCKGLPLKTRLQNDLVCVEWKTKTLTHYSADSVCGFRINLSDLQNHAGCRRCKALYFGANCNIPEMMGLNGAG